MTNVKYDFQRDMKLSQTLGPIIAKCFNKDPNKTMVSVNSGVNTEITGIDGKFVVVHIFETSD